MDEARFGLFPITRKVWSPRGVRPIRITRLRYQWAYVFGVVEPATGKVFSMIWDSVSLPIMQYFLNEYSKTLASDEVSLMVLDGAGWHSEKGLQWQPNIVALKQPAYSPECNPTESLWDWMQNKISVQLFDSMDELKQRLIEILLFMDLCKEELKQRLNYHWWKNALIQI